MTFGFRELRYEVVERVATLTFNRPQYGNAWTPVLEEELRAAVAQAAASKDVRVIVLTGAGKAFCVGADMAVLANGDQTRQRITRSAPRSPEDLSQRYSYLLGVNKPLIAGMNGAASGVGLCLSLFCDLRFMAAGAKLSVPYARRGLAAEHGVAWLLRRQIGPMNAADLLLTGRTVSADEAGEMGLVRVLPAQDFSAQVQQRASQMGNLCSPRATRIIKHQLWAAHEQTLAQATQLADFELEQCLGTPDLEEGVAHFLEKREPNFPDTA